MERKLILASHGKLASGITSSLELICGKQLAIETLDCYLTEDFDLQKEVKNIMNAYRDDEIVVVTDLFGGSVNNEFLTQIDRPNFYLVAGMNLPFLVELSMQLQQAESLPKLIESTLETSKQTIQFCNQAIMNQMEEEEF
ncbi:PTS mannose transporter subunit IIA [Enterococcus raffinosus]|uniref:PTS sugar transporter subunit IIA n=1 Tax=Enterococcus raffinosus TaxID=71452 RepID=UPI001C129621|nr:PTS mannose transporter subunit IIA [Enterococcus raffinosus]MBU5363062.1 PTS mannose transporter subunit IIA [Enterococcus raffinosus]